MISINKNRLHKRRTSNSTILVLMALSFLLSFTITITVFHPFDQVQVPLAAAQQEYNNNSNNTKPVSTSLLSTISTAIGTGAAATGAIVTVPGFLRARKQPKFLAIYLLKIHNEYDRLCKKTKSLDKNKNEYLDFLESLRRDIIYLLENGDINENQYKMLEDRIAEYMSKIRCLN
jgi:hypothetical protein